MHTHSNFLNSRIYLTKKVISSSYFTSVTINGSVSDSVLHSELLLQLCFTGFMLPSENVKSFK